MNASLPKVEAKPSWLELPDINPEEFDKVVETRRSVRRFTDEPVPDEVVNHLLDLAMLAPNSCNLQPWEFYVVRDSKVKASLAKACMGQNAATTAQVLIPIVARTDTWLKHCDETLEVWPQEKVPKIIETFYSKVAKFQYALGPLGSLGLFKKGVYSVAGLFTPVPRGPYSKSEMKEWATKSTALAAQTLMLGFRAYGFDTCPMEGFDHNRVKKILKLPRKANVIMILGVGKRAENGIYHERYRFDRNRFIHEI